MLPFFKRMGRDMLCILLASVDSPQDKRKLELLYEKYNREMYVTANKILHHTQDAEDACLTAWEKIIKNLDKIKKKLIVRKPEVSSL